jgi:hypothetical protein
MSVVFSEKGRKLNQYLTNSSDQVPILANFKIREMKHRNEGRKILHSGTGILRAVYLVMHFYNVDFIITD